MPSGCGLVFSYAKATNMPKDFQGNFSRRNRDKVALNSFLTGRLLTHDFGGVIVFTSVNCIQFC